MVIRAKSPKDFWAGVIYVAIGVAMSWTAGDYAFGTTSRMGPGYFPIVVAGLLILLGIIAIGRSLVLQGEKVHRVAWKPLFLILAATTLFGALISAAGLIVALLVLVLMSAAASEKFRLDWRAGLGLIFLIAFCGLVFVKGLGVPMPIIGSLFAPLFGSG